MTGSAQPAFASVSRPPASGTPELATTGTTQQVRQMVQCGQTMYAVGSFTLIRRIRHDVCAEQHFQLQRGAPYRVTSWNPDVNGVVNTIAFNGTNCSTAYIGGKFTSVHGTPAANIAAISTSTGAVQTGFAHHANGQVETIASSHSHLLVGGYFTLINGSGADRYMASLNPATGKDDGFISLNISGNYRYCNSSGTRCASSNNTRVYNQQLSHGGSLDLVEGDFTSVGGQSRQQIFMLDLSGTTAKVTAWTSAAFNQHCWFTEPFYVRQPRGPLTTRRCTSPRPAFTSLTGTEHSRSPASVTSPQPSPPARPRSAPSGSTTPDAIRCIRPRPTRRPHTSAGMSGGRRTRAAATRQALARSPRQEWRACRQAAAC